MQRAFILNRRPYRENSLLVDLFTEESGKITSVVRVAKKRGKIIQGSLEPFRLVLCEWKGRGNVMTMTSLEESARYPVLPKNLGKAFYINELFVKLLPAQAPMSPLFSLYHKILLKLCDEIEASTFMYGELKILHLLGHPVCALAAQHPPQPRCYYSQSQGFIDGQDQYDAIPVSASLFVKLAEKGKLTGENERECREFLNQLFDRLLEGKVLHSRRLAFV
ncbi:MAG: DNA recombination and repair protein RecO [uncultured Thiotrichaceae bacterium]|uniref:DNA repair protein RecO n=1 Tax=uncultured Thiotrichaceae bacterium TaxID=298394 RepID=A0A6S6T557_9GAMM|nr:MAG: DNA recombination and repair protein RecO [uncultured Thiotrichaceae bacterium]